MNLNAYRDELSNPVPGDGPFLTASLDLTPGNDGRSVAAVVFRKALAAAVSHAERDEHALSDALVFAVGESIDHATASGAQGLHLVGSPGGVTELTSPLPFRNHVRLGKVPWVFELERQSFLLSRPVLAVEVTRSDVRIVRIEGMGVSEDTHVTRDEHGTRQIHGRQASEGRSGAAGVSGGHSRNRIDRVVDEKRAVAAREAAREVEALHRRGDIVILAGTPEPRAEFLRQLSASVANAIVGPILPALPSDLRHLIELASDVGAKAQLEAGDAAAERIISGGAGEQIARGRGAVEVALEGGRISELVIHEDVVAHWGSSLDARRQLPEWDDAPYEAILRATLLASGAVAFSRLQDLMERYEGIAATTRW